MITCASVTWSSNGTKCAVEKTIEGNTKESKVRMNQHISDCKTGVSTCKVPRHVTFAVLRIIA